MEKVAELISDYYKSFGAWGIVIAVLLIVGIAVFVEWLKSHFEHRNAIKLANYNDILEKKRTAQLSTSQSSPPIVEVLAGIEEIRQELTRIKTHDVRYVEVMEFVIDENRAHGLKTIAERCIGSVDKAIPFIQQADTFDDFLNNAGIKLDVNESVRTGFQYQLMNGQQTFAVPTVDNPTQNEWATFTTESNGVVHMNTAAHRHFDWCFDAFKKKYDVKFQTPKGMAVIQQGAKAASSIYEKYIPVLSKYPNCVFPLLGIEDTEEQLKAIP